MTSLPKQFVAFSLALIYLCLLSETANAQDYPKKINFRNIMQNQDIALGEVEAITQDHEGFIWLGGRNALLRYDGYDFLSVLIADDINNLSKMSPVTQVVEVMEDSRHDMWVATRSGLYKYDRNREALYHLKLQNSEHTALLRTAINALAEAPTGEILAGSGAGLLIIDPATLSMRQIQHIDGDNNSLPGNAINDLYVDKLNMVWLGIDEGLLRIDWNTSKQTLFIPNPQNPKSTADNGIKTINQDHDGATWFGTDNGVYRLNPSDNSITIYQHNPKDPYSLANNISRQIYVDKSGWIWTGSDQGGISLYDKANDRFIRFGHEEGRSGSLSSNTIRRIFEDDNEDMWIGTYPSGVNFYDRTTSAITVYKKRPI